MKIESVINLAAVAVISGYIGRRIQQKKDIQALSEVLNEVTKTLEKEPRKRKPVSYTSYSKYAERRTKPNSEFIFETSIEAREVLRTMAEIVRDYGQATVADVYDMVGIPSTFTNNKYGWTDVSRATIGVCREGYLLKFPEAKELK